jgi:uncharacterized protein YndB with AHSA1/START domain
MGQPVRLDYCPGNRVTPEENQMRTVATAVVDAPVSRVWDTLADHEGMSSWGPIKVTLDKEGTPDRNGVGAVRRIVGKGPVPAIIEEVVAFEPQQRLGYKALAGVPFRNYSGEITLTATERGTRIDWALTIDERVPLVEKAAVSVLAKGMLNRLVKAVKRS